MSVTIMARFRTSCGNFPLNGIKQLRVIRSLTCVR